MACQITVEVQKDLEDIWLYTLDNWSLQQADRYLTLIFDEFAYLTINPDSGRDCSHIRKQYRSAKVKSHIIFYRQLDNTADIEIVRVLHQSMDYEGRLTE